VTSQSDGTLCWIAGDVRLELSVEPGRPVALRCLRIASVPSGELPAGAPLVEVALSGDGRGGHSANAQHRGYATSRRLRYAEHTAEPDRLTVRQRDPDTGLDVTVHIEHRPGARVLRCWTVVSAAAPVCLAFVSSLALSGFVDAPGRAYPDTLRLHCARNAWAAEFRWQEMDLARAGLVDIGAGGDNSSRGCFPVRSASTWSTGDYLPSGGLEHTGTGHGWAWQVEHNGAWQWQLSDLGPDVYLSAGGPTEPEHQWSVRLAPGEEFTTVPAAIAVSAEGFHGALRELNRYRRVLRRDAEDNRALPVIFNDYMNCLNGDPTTAKLLPLIERAAGLGAEYFVIDAGWYSDTAGWWDTVGAWRPSTTRFPGGGLRAVTDAIHAAGMRPGLWLEPEVVGVDSPVATELPDAAFFCRSGRRIVDNGRYQLDYRHPAVIARMDKVIDGLVYEYGLGYFKFDYNISPGAGTDVGGVAAGHGMLGHNRAFLAWLDGVFDRHPALVIENCSSGGMRVDYAQLSRMSIQSTSDQTDPLRYVPIAAAAPSAVTPEQSAVWAYPQPGWSADLNALTVVSALLGRVHLSGRVDLLDEDQLSAVAQGMAVYKAIRHRLPVADPYWPLGLPGWYDDWSALALRTPEAVLLAVWRRGGGDTVRLPLPCTGSVATVRYPTGTAATVALSGTDLTVSLPAAPSACLIEVS
jgi:alpha-galactosidase